MIISKLISGLGNQLFQYTLARQLAIKNHASLKLDLSFFKDQSLRSFKLNHFNIQANIATSAELDEVVRSSAGRSFYSKLYNKIEGRLPKYYQRHYKENEWWVYEPEVFKTFGNVYLEGYWQHYKYYNSLDKNIFAELTLADTRELHSSPYYSAIKQDEYAASIHIRRTDYITDKDANNLMGILPLTYYQNAIKNLEGKIGSPSYYIFSDDLNWAKDNLKINAPVTFVDIEDGKKDYLELTLMSKCRHNIIANSSFSWWGAFLNRNPNKAVYIPANWVANQSINQKIKLDFPSWQKI